MILKKGRKTRELAAGLAALLPGYRTREPPASFGLLASRPSRRESGERAARGDVSLGDRRKEAHPGEGDASGRPAAGPGPF